MNGSISARRRGMCAGSSSLTSVRFSAKPYDASTALASSPVGVIFSSAIDGLKVMLSRKIALMSS